MVKPPNRSSVAPPRAPLLPVHPLIYALVLCGRTPPDIAVGFSHRGFMGCAGTTKLGLATHSLAAATATPDIRTWLAGFLVVGGGVVIVFTTEPEAPRPAAVRRRSGLLPATRHERRTRTTTQHTRQQRRRSPASRVQRAPSGLDRGGARAARSAGRTARTQATRAPPPRRRAAICSRARAAVSRRTPQRTARCRA